MPQCLLSRARLALKGYQSDREKSGCPRRFRRITTKTMTAMKMVTSTLNRVMTAMIAAGLAIAESEVGEPPAVGFGSVGEVGDGPGWPLAVD